VLQAETDSRYMQEALDHGRYALGRTAPNPSVGAVVVDAGGLAGCGWTQPPGGDHAEVVALKEAGSRTRGATLYVTLEPCCHHGRTPPCTAAIIATGIRRCVVAVEDPFPGVHGRGIAQLRAAGITVDVGIGTTEATELHAGFFHRISTGHPLVRAKYAMTLDGKIATHTGDSRWITGENARRYAHILRDRADAVMVGAGTVRIDDPLLTTRLPEEFTGDGGPHHPTRVVVDGRGTTSPQARVYAPDLPGQTLVATTQAAPLDWITKLADQGVDYDVCGTGPLVDLAHLLERLGDRGMNDVLVEGGGQLLGGLLDAGLVDRVAAFVAPKLVGGASAPGPVAGTGSTTINGGWQVVDGRVSSLDGDLLVEGAVRRALGEEA
jgi:diaminohydroxyphosphoribosylaminopyrimidine deaminase / 5-amino-6-(5-phosphoribosylamino)uracil reductase